jgi:hypothetical protein
MKMTNVNNNAVYYYLYGKLQQEKRDNRLRCLELSQNAFELAKKYNLANQIQSGLDNILDYIVSHDAYICKSGSDTLGSYDLTKEHLVEIRDMTEIITDLKSILDELMERFEDAYCSGCIFETQRELA